MVQGELFIEDKDGAGNEGASFFSAHQISLTLDKIILVAIGCLILFVLTFSFGYERGKRTAEERMQTLTSHIETIPQGPAAPDSVAVNNSEVAQKQNSESAPKTAIENAVVPQLNSTKATSEKGTPKAEEAGSAFPLRKYTIQVATAVSQETAEKEVAALTKKGETAFFVKSGRYYAICVGSFESVKSAKPILGQLKTMKFYSGAFVRPSPQI